MRNMYTSENMYGAFSLVEMLLTIVIIGFVMTLSAVTLTTLIKVSTISSYKTATRNDVYFISEISQRSLSNTSLEDIYIYDSSNIRSFNLETMTVENNTESTSEDISVVYEDGSLLSVGNEVHVRNFGYNRWTCLGYFKDSNGIGYVVKTSVASLNDHSSCFEPGSTASLYQIVLNSTDLVDVTQYQISKVPLRNDNTMFTVDIIAQPLYWPVGYDVPVNKSISKQVNITTQGLTWY